MLPSRFKDPKSLHNFTLSPPSHPFTAVPPATCSTKCLAIKERLPSFCNAVIRANIEKGSPAKALLAFKSMVAAGALRPGHRTLALVVKACTISSHLSGAAQAHGKILKSGHQWRISLSVPLFHMYLSRDLLTDANPLFDDIMLQESDPYYGNLLIRKLSRKGEIEKAYQVFKRMPARDTVSWNSMIAAVHGCRPKEALSLYRRMILSGVDLDCFTFSTVLSACARAGALGHGERVHRLMEKKVVDYESNPILCSAVIDMYAKCGRISDARMIFDAVEKTSRSIWNSMINGLAIHGLGADALKLFYEMTAEEISPDAITFLEILTACSHSGMVEEARFYFRAMQRDFQIKPQVKHYGAMVDALARAGKLSEAYETITSMKIEPDVAIWRALLAACRKHGRRDLAETTIAEMRRCSSGDFVLLSSIYSSGKQWDNAERVWRAMKEKGIRKGRGLSWAEVNGRVYQFKAGDRSSSESSEIYQILADLMRRAKAEGYVPITELVAKDVNEEEKEENLSSHSEKLAVAFCVMKKEKMGKKISPGTEEIRVSKNLQTCRDCHEWMKAVSKVLRREIVVRDRIRFHRFEMGVCSCNDYW